MKLFGVCLLLLTVIGCQQDDGYYEQKDELTEDVMQGKTSVMSQQELMDKYAGNNLGTILKNDFKHESSDKTVMSSSGSVPVYIDLDYVQVFESEGMHAITYHVVIGDEEKDAKDNPKVLYNLMYYSLDYKNYYVILYRYDFTEIPFDAFIKNPNSILNVLGFIPLNDIEDIYENIAYSFSEGLKRTSSSEGVYPSYFYEMKNLSDCVEEVSYPSEPCKKCGRDYGQPGCRNTDRSTRAKPPMSFMDFSDCYDTPPARPGGGGGIPNPIGGHPGTAPEPTNPIKGLPVKKHGDLVLIGGGFAEVNIGLNNQNVKTLKAISRDLKGELQYFRSNLSLTKELGRAYRFETVNGVYKKITQEDLPNPSGQNRMIDANKASYHMNGIFHSHFYGSDGEDPLMPLFTATDLAAIFKFVNTSAQAPDRKPSEAFMGVVNQYGAYVVMLPNDVTHENISERYSDFTRTNTQSKVFPAPTKPQWKNMGEELKDKYKRILHFSAISDKKKAYEKALLEVMKKYKLELNLYFLDSNGGQFNGSWQRVTLNNEEIQYTTIN
ncbi:MAG TPA: hypothetical protein VKY32_02785 [Flavobacterium sp.]|nr:hypothetical protein [Flavobacterium sp.]